MRSGVGDEVRGSGRGRKRGGDFWQSADGIYEGIDCGDSGCLWKELEGWGDRGTRRSRGGRNRRVARRGRGR